VAYDGGGFHGFAAQRGVKTVGGTLATSIERVLGHPIDLACAGRTDTGVHGWGQVVSFDAEAEGLDLERLQRSVNKMCAPAISVRDAAAAPSEFDARHSATSRRYRYTVLNRDAPDPFMASTSWLIEQPLDRKLLTLACDPLLGEHDFAAFCRRPKVDGEPPSLVRRVLDARWIDEGDGILRFWIEANAFCHQMVRSLVGTLVEVGMRKRTAGDVTQILRSGDRSKTPNLAPPHGLCLWEVRY
jgi:tRNA pseudouridine38-40 synthase